MDISFHDMLLTKLKYDIKLLENISNKIMVNAI